MLRGGDAGEARGKRKEELWSKTNSSTAWRMSVQVQCAPNETPLPIAEAEHPYAAHHSTATEQREEAEMRRNQPGQEQQVPLLPLLC
jgi:hypothetical protein